MSGWIISTTGLLVREQSRSIITCDCSVANVQIYSTKTRRRISKQQLDKRSCFLSRFTTT